MKRGWWLVALLGLSGMPLVAAGPAVAAAVPARPNIVLVLVDDMGWGDFSCFGNQLARTPAIDRLAAEGMRFTQFYVNAPICSPSRVALTTGQYPQRWRISSYLDNRAENTRRGMAQWLDPQAPVVARQLRAAGYATGHFGKWHMGGQRNVGDAPLITEYGFDESLTNFEGLGPRLLPLCDSGNGKVTRHALGSDTLGRGTITWMDRSRITGGYTNAAIDFAKRAVAAGKPFYLNVWPDDVHSPFFPPLERRANGKQALYHAVLETMDEQLAPLFEWLRSDPKLRDNTLVLVCSDNGPEPGAGSAGKFRGAKTTLYEGGVRSPLIAWAPGLLATGKAGTRNDTAVFCALDLARSLIALGGATPPAQPLDGEELSATLLGRADASRAAPICWRRPPDRKSWPQYGLGAQPDLAIRAGNWKLLCDYDGSHPQLYDLTADPAEASDVAAANPEVVARLTKQLLDWHQALPPDNGPALGAAKPAEGKPAGNKAEVSE